MRKKTLANQETIGKIIVEYMETDVTLKDLGLKYNLTTGQIASIVARAKRKLLPMSQTIQKNMTKNMEAQIEESITRQYNLGESLIKKATDAVARVTITDINDLNQTAKTGVDITRKALGLKDDDDKVTAIQINLSVPIQLGNEFIGNIQTKEVQDVEFQVETPAITTTVNPAVGV